MSAAPKRRTRGSVPGDHAAELASAKQMNMEMWNFLATIVADIGEKTVTILAVIRRRDAQIARDPADRPREGGDFLGARRL